MAGRRPSLLDPPGRRDPRWAQHVSAPRLRPAVLRRTQSAARRALEARPRPGPAAVPERRAVRADRAGAAPRGGLMEQRGVARGLRRAVRAVPLLRA